MRSRHAWLPVLALTLSATALGTAPASSAPPTDTAQQTTPRTTPPRPATPSLREEEQYWTADRMTDAVPTATPSAPRAHTDAATPHAHTDAVTPHSTPPPGTPRPEHFAGHPTVGTFFFDSKPLGGKSTFCTGSVVHTAAKDIVLTAGHCGTGLQKATHRIFVPRYVSGKPAASQPYGVFPVTRVYIDPRYVSNTKKPVSDLDLAFTQTAPNSRGKRLEDVTGALTFTATATGYTQRVTVLGYPSAEKVNPRHNPIRCPVTTQRLPGYGQLKMACTGFYGGVSGGPWIKDYDPAKGTGKVIGATGGYNGGGNDANDDWVTYAPLFGKDAQALFNDAAAHRAVGARPPYKTLVLPDFAPAVWKHAVGMTAGYFTGGSPGGSRHMDLIVRWDDGRVSLYQGGDTTHPFTAEYQLAPSKSIWADAVSLTTVNTGGKTDGLAVRWTDGEMTLYPTVDPQGFHGEKQLAPPQTALWRDTVQLMTGGRFTPGGNRDDLLVTFKDGHVSLYADLATNGLSDQTQITAKNTTWPHAGQLTTATVTSSPTDDVIVRWSDGETTLYPGLTAQALPAETQLQPPNSPWKNATLVTAGAFTANTTANDVIVRWTDGHVSLFTGTDTKGLHTETPLT
ncbi:trypsin-like serine peptidase [Streptomyces acidiscabies]|uniref:trypsin-like serine peptidase n=1 Tax=Streptomyces acidiscabies TaxID=42234 RepID=UPI000A8079D8|nr:trypsin-like serine protease [Streptomyces acidiscabies]